MNTSLRLDRLSALLEGLSPRVLVQSRMEEEGALSFPAETKAALWLQLVLGGSVRLLPAGEPPVVVDSASMIVCSAHTPHRLRRPTGAAGKAHEVISAKVHLDGPVASMLMAEFRRPMVVSLAAADDSLGLVIQLVRSEIGHPRCGQPLLLDRAGDILFIGLLRHLVAHSHSPSGLFQGLADPRIARVLVALHAAPQSDWRLESMAEVAAMSRTAFANGFRQAMTVTPGKYLSRLRLAIAQRAVELGDGLKQAARRTGYRNVSSLSRALSRDRNARS